MKNYQSPTLHVVEASSEDIILTSSPHGTDLPILDEELFEE